MTNYYWQTPLEVFKEYDDKFHFDLDPCTTKDNPLKTKFYFTEEQDGLKQEFFGNVFINPPYSFETLSNGKRGKYLLELWVKKAWSEINKKYTKCNNIVMLLPAVTSVGWFHTYIWNDKTNRPFPNTSIIFPKGRIAFLDKGKKRQSPRFDSMIVILSRPRLTQ